MASTLRRSGLAGAGAAAESSVPPAARPTSAASAGRVWSRSASRARVSASLDWAAAGGGAVGRGLVAARGVFRQGAPLRVGGHGNDTPLPGRDRVFRPLRHRGPRGGRLRGCGGGIARDRGRKRHEDGGLGPAHREEDREDSGEQERRPTEIRAEAKAERRAGARRGLDLPQDPSGQVGLRRPRSRGPEERQRVLELESGAPALRAVRAVGFEMRPLSRIELAVVQPGKKVRRSSRMLPDVTAHGTLSPREERQQDRAQLPPAPRDARLHGADRQLERHRDLFVAPLLEVPEDDRQTELDRELLECVADRSPRLVRLARRPPGSRCPPHDPRAHPATGPARRSAGSGFASGTGS